MTAPAALVRLFDPWNHLYANSKLVAIVVTFGHIASLVFAGGLAIVLDRGTFRAVRGSAEERGRHLSELATAHRWVLYGLGMLFLTGILLLTSDIETFWGSSILWTKIALIALLLINGAVMRRSELALRNVASENERGWSRLRLTAVTSITLWFAITFAGVALVNL